MGLQATSTTLGRTIWTRCRTSVFTYGDSLLTQINPVSLRANKYGNSDYDIRHTISADFVYSPGFRFGNRFLNAALGGWQSSGKVFWRTGLPFSVLDGNTAVGNYAGDILAEPLAGAGPSQTTCGAAAASPNNPVPCLNANGFVNAGSSTFTGYIQWSQQGRNSFRGPHYFDTDMALFKNFKITERLASAWVRKRSTSSIIRILGFRTIHTATPLSVSDFDYGANPDQPVWQLPGIRLVTAGTPGLG